jgi:beta-glucuronidase
LEEGPYDVVMLPPRDTISRDCRRLDGLWAFAFDHGGEGRARHWWSGVLPASRPMPVPSSYNDLVTEAFERDHVGEVWYQREVLIPTTWSGERVVLRCDAVTHSGTVWVDDAQVASHVGGYTPFEVDVTDCVTPGRSVRITICVDNRLAMDTIPPGLVQPVPRENGMTGERQAYFHDFFNYSGLHRSVWLYTRPAAHIEAVKVVTSYSGGAGTVDYAVQVQGQGETSVRLFDAERALVAGGSGAQGTLVLDHARPWQPGSRDTAHLYRLEVTHGSDVYPLDIGVRSVRVEGNRFLINDKPFVFKGFGMHEDLALRGKAHDDVRMIRDFALLRWIGANSFRTSHYPYADEVLDHADREGIVVISETAATGLHLSLNGMTGVPMQETFTPGGIDEHTQAAHLQAVRELIARDAHHPSVVMWSLANEPNTAEPAARTYFEPIVALARELDPSRPLTIVNVGGTEPETDTVADLVDVICLNRYLGWYFRSGDIVAAEITLEDELRRWLGRYGKPVLITEFGADAVAGLHSLPPRMWSEEFQTDLIAMSLAVFRRNKGVIGEHVWNFADFMTAEQYHRVVGNRKGVFTREREPKAVAFLLRDAWLPSTLE